MKNKYKFTKIAFFFRTKRNIIKTQTKLLFFIVLPSVNLYICQYINNLRQTLIAEIKK